jgi:predicted TIM-barrel enzyme
MGGSANLFGIPKPIFGMVHLKGEDGEGRLEIAKKEIGIYEEAGLDGIIVENYFGSEYDVESALDYIRGREFDMMLGVNVLNNDRLGFGMAKKYRADFLQLDSVAGHLEPDKDLAFHKFIQEQRAGCGAKVLGGIRFKYQPYLSGRSLEEDMRIGMERCDAIVVTQDATGQETSMEKIMQFRALLGHFPLFAGAGMTAENCPSQLAVVDGAIVGSYFKDTHKADGDVCLSCCAGFMSAVKKARGEMRGD